MKRHPITLSVCLALCCSLGAARAQSPPDTLPTSEQRNAVQTGPDYQEPLPIPGHADILAPEVDVSGVHYHLQNQDLIAARNELIRLRAENPGWQPPKELEQLLGPAVQPDSEYLARMAELAALSESERAALTAERLNDAASAVRRYQDAPHAMLLGWIHFQRQEYVTAEQLFGEAEQWGEAAHARQALGLVSQRLAHQAVEQGDYATALHHAAQATERGNEEGFLSTGWSLFNKQRYDEAFTAFSNAPPSAKKDEALAETCYRQARRALAAGDDTRAEQAAACSQQHGRTTVLTDLGWTLYDSGHFARASRFFAAQQPPSEPARYGDALARQADGDIQGAMELACADAAHSERLTQLCIDLISAQMLSDHQAGRHEAVLRHAEDLAPFGPLSDGMQAMLAWSELYAGHHDAAAGRFDQLLTQQPDEASYAHGLIESLSRRDDTRGITAARERHPLLDTILAMRAANLSPPSFQLDLSRYQADPAGNPSASPFDAGQVSHAVDLYHAGDYARAHELLQAMRPAMLESRDHGLLTLSGWAAFHNGNITQAREDFVLAAEWTDEADIWLMVVETDIVLQDLQQARATTEALPPSMKRDRMLIRLKGLQAAAAYHNREYALAESLFSDPALADNDDHIEMLGWSRYQQGHYAGAITAFEPAYRANPTLARAKGLVFSHIHLGQPGPLIALADTLQGPLAELTADPQVRSQLEQGREDWIWVDAEGYLIVQEPEKKTSALTRGLRKLEGLPGATWGSIDHSLVDSDTHVSYLINQGIDWVVLPGDITLNTFIEYRSIHQDWKSLYDEDELVAGLEFKRSPFKLGIEYAPARWRNDDQERDTTTAYLGWYHSWYNYLRRRGSTARNPFDVDAYEGATYGRITHQFDDGNGDGAITTARGFIRQGMDWFTTINKAGEFTLNTYAAYRYRFRDRDNYWYDAHGPAIGIELQRRPFSLGVDYMRQYHPRRNTSEAKYGLYLTWYYDWNLRPD